MNDTLRATDPVHTGKPLLPRGGKGQWADLAFGSLSLRRSEALTTDGLDPGRHLAFLPTEALNLDLCSDSQRQFGDYELLEMIGEGGMGVVYRARQISLDREVAVKLLSAGPWASREFVERFQREAQNAARMQHPNIVAIHEVGAVDDMHFFSMRLIRGSSLAEELKRGGKLSALRAAGLMRTIAEAVDYAHRLGVLHLDLKPANVLIDETGIPHVADFGLARRLEQGLAADNTEISGTPSYMAPEQATPGAQKITPATDIWGLGAILYELVTGKPPFAGSSAQATLKLVTEGQLRSPRRYAPDLPPDLEAIILKCMTRAAAERYASARALADDLTRFIEGREVRARRLNRLQRVGRWARREPKIAALVLLVLIALIVGVTGISVQWQRAQANARQAQTNAQEATRSANLASERLWQARIDKAEVMLRDGHTYQALPSLVANIREREAQGLDTREDRVRLAMVERGAPRLIDSIALGSWIRGVAISPDGASVAVSTDDEKLRLFDTVSGKQRWQTGFHDATHFFPKFFRETEIHLAMLRFTPDGRYLIGRHWIGNPNFPVPAGRDEVMFDAANGTLLTPRERVPDFTDVTYSPDGEFAVVRRGDRQEAVFMRTGDWRALGTPSAGPRGGFWLVTAAGRHVVTYTGGELQIREPKTLAVRHAIKYEPGQRVTSWASTPAGDAFLAGHLDGMIERIDCASGRREQITPSPIGSIGAIAFSPDGRWFGAVADSGEVLVWDSVARALVAPPLRLNTRPEWRHFQLFIDASAGTVMASANYEMSVWSVRGRLDAIRLSGGFPIATDAYNHNAFAHHAAQGLIATDAGQGELRLWRVQRSTPEGMRGPPFAPIDLRTEDGRMAQVQDDEVVVVDAADGRPLSPVLKMPQAVSAAELSPDGNSLIVVVGNQVSVYDAATWTPRRAPITLPDDPADLLLNPDSRHVLVRFARYHDGRNVELAQIWDLVEGVPSSLEAELEPKMESPRQDGTFPPVPGARLRFSPDGRNLVSWVEGTDGLQVYDGATLAPRWPRIEIDKILAEAGEGNGNRPQLDVEVHDARFSADGSRVQALTASKEADLSRLHEFDASSGAERRRIKLSETGGGERFAVLPDRDAVIVQRERSGPLWWDGANGARELPTQPMTETRTLALARDGSLFAHATTTNAVLTSTRSLAWLSPPMPVTGGSPTRLGFTRDGHGLIGRGEDGSLSYWDVNPDLRPIAQLEREAELLNPDRTKAEGAVAPGRSDAERQWLRGNDPGAPVRPEQRRTATRYPPRRADTPANLFDLGAFYNFPIGSGEDVHQATGPYELAPGRHRFLGVDYDARGTILLTAERVSHMAGSKHPAAVRGIRPGIPRFAALNILITGCCMLASHEPHPYAFVELDYADGSHERTAIVYQRDVMEAWSGDPAGNRARVAWRAHDVVFRLFHVRCANPHPERLVRSIAIEASEERFSGPSIFAITAEPVEASPNASGTSD
ncbi:MAG TPA: WD40 repeat domain-containing serine/threonine protein kinase [Rudaea sp.]|nr:WD40 repeat domain-containing serine/threonine protein kinase [Rudaea sp.]